MNPTDRGPSMLVQILRQSTGTLAVTIENYEHIMKTSKLIDVEGMNFTKYYATMKSIADNLYSWNHFPVREVVANSAQRQKDVSEGLSSDTMTNRGRRHGGGHSITTKQV